MNQQLKDYRKKNRQTASQKTTDGINRAATLRNALAYEHETEKSVFVQELLQEQDVRASYCTSEGERNCQRLENKLLKILKEHHKVCEAHAAFMNRMGFIS